MIMVETKTLDQKRREKMEELRIELCKNIAREDDPSEKGRQSWQIVGFLLRMIIVIEKYNSANKLNNPSQSSRYSDDLLQLFRM